MADPKMDFSAPKAPDKLIFKRTYVEGLRDVPMTQDVLDELGIEDYFKFKRDPQKEENFQPHLRHVWEVLEYRLKKIEKAKELAFRFIRDRQLKDSFEYQLQDELGSMFGKIRERLSSRWEPDRIEVYIENVKSAVEYCIKNQIATQEGVRRMLDESVVDIPWREDHLDSQNIEYIENVEKAAAFCRARGIKTRKDVEVVLRQSEMEKE